MSSKKRQPKWWQLYLMLPVFMGLFWLELQIPLTYAENVIAQAGILVLIFVFMQMWLHANRSAFMNLEEEEGQWEVRVYRFPPLARGALGAGDERPAERPALDIPAAGVKGVLTETFEWESPEKASSVFSEQRVDSRKE